MIHALYSGCIAFIFSLALGYPIVPALYVLGSFALVWNTLVERPTESIAGLLLVALGLPFYWRWSRAAQ